MGFQDDMDTLNEMKKRYYKLYFKTKKEYNSKGVDRIYDQMAIMAEFDEWFEPQEDLEVISLDEISKDQYDDFVDHKNQ